MFNCTIPCQAITTIYHHCVVNTLGLQCSRYWNQGSEIINLLWKSIGRHLTTLLSWSHFDFPHLTTELGVSNVTLHIEFFSRNWEGSEGQLLCNQALMGKYHTASLCSMLWKKYMLTFCNSLHTLFSSVICEKSHFFLLMWYRYTSCLILLALMYVVL